MRTKISLILILLIFLPTISFCLEPTDNGHTWVKASYSQKMNICERLANSIKKYNHPAGFYYECINAFYAPGTLEIKIAEIAGLCAVAGQ